MPSKQNKECNDLDINGMEDSGSCLRAGHIELYIPSNSISLLPIYHSKANIAQLPIAIGGVPFEIDIQQNGPFYMKPRGLTPVHLPHTAIPLSI